MAKENEISRRKFIASSAMSAGAVGLGISEVRAAGSESTTMDSDKNRSPREPLVLSVTAEKIDENGNIPEQMIERMQVTATYKPDLICLPEAFATTPKTAEPVPGPIINIFSEWAKKHHCYIICPIHARKSGRVYNTAVLIDREGKVVGMYDKIYPTEGEIDDGVTPGKLKPPVFKTDFGTIGILICFDVNWIDAWRKLKEQGAEIVFWTAAYPAGRMLPSYAWMFQYYVVGCSQRDPALIYDMSGDFITSSGTYEHWALASLNLEKIFCEIDFHVKKVKQIRKKYGRKVRIVYYNNEDWVTIESRSPDLTIQQLIDEFGLVSHQDYIDRATRYQNKFR